MNVDFKNKRGTFAKLQILAAVCLSAAAIGASLMPGAAFAQIATSELSANAPSRYVVVKGDTLWAISGRFLRAPSKWPQIWNLNKDQIRNPHLIYPGDVVRLDVVDGRAQLSLDRGNRSEIRLSPGVRFEDVGNDAIPMISPSAIRPFLAKPLLVDMEQFTNAPRIVSNEGGRMNAGAGSKTYVTGLNGDAERDYAVYRQGPALVDPITKETLAIEAIYLGKVRLVRNGEPALMEIIESGQELSRGDRLVSIPAEPSLNVPLTPAPSGLDARVIKVYDNQAAAMYGSKIETVRNYDREGGPLSVIILNRGSDDGLAVGQVVQIESKGKLIPSHSTLGFKNGQKADPSIQLPDEINGTAVIFHSFENISYALVMKASKSILSGDAITAP